MANKTKERQQRRKSNAADWAKKQEQKGPKSIRLPDGCEWYRPEVGVHKVDFMPYVVGKNNPTADEGMEHFERTYEVHKIPMPGDQTEFILCAAKCFGKKCAVCTFVRQCQDAELIKALRANTRHLWLVNDKPGNAKNKLKVFDTNHYNKGAGFGEMLADAINGDQESRQDFTDLERGSTLTLTVKEQSWPGGKYKAVTRIDFSKRNYTYPDSVIDDAPCLDDCLVEPDYNTVMRLLGGDVEDDEDDQDDTVDDQQEQINPDDNEGNNTNDVGNSNDSDSDNSDDTDEDDPRPRRRR